MRIAGQRVIVTGGSRGIGRALVGTLLDAGARVATCGRHAETMRAVETDCGAGDALLARVCDVADPEQVAAFVAEVEGTWDGVDVLVNNAAVLLQPGPVADTPLDVWERTLRVNVLGSVAMIRAVLPGMRARGHGAIVNLSSGWGRVAAPEVAPYCASKFAIEALSASLASEVPRDIVVVALDPGVIDTAMLRSVRAMRADLCPTPDTLGPAWLRFFERLGPASSGRPLSL